MPVDSFFFSGKNLLTLDDLGLDLFLKMKRIGGKIQTVPENGWIPNWCSHCVVGLAASDVRARQALTY